MPEVKKIKVSNEGRWIRVAGIAKQEGEKTIVTMGRDHVTVWEETLTDWETFLFNRELAKESGLFLDKTGAQGLIIRRPENPAEDERKKALASVFSNWKSDYEDLPESTRDAIDFIINGEIERGEL